MTLKYKVSKMSVGTAAALLFCTAAMTPKPASAQWVVIDPTNLVENILNEYNTLQATVNQATQIANELQQIALAVQSLQQLPASILNGLLADYLSACNQLKNSFASINGLASNLTSVTSKYNSLFPNRQLSPGLTASQVLSQSQQFLTQARTELQGVDQVTAQVGAQAAQMTSDLSINVGALNSADGDVKALQAVGQIEAEIATEIAQLNTLIMAMNQAQTTELAQQVQDREDAIRRTIDIGVTPPAAPASPVAYFP